MSRGWVGQGGVRWGVVELGWDEIGCNAMRGYQVQDGRLGWDGVESVGLALEVLAWIGLG